MRYDDIGEYLTIYLDENKEQYINAFFDEDRFWRVQDEEGKFVEVSEFNPSGVVEDIYNWTLQVINNLKKDIN